MAVVMSENLDEEAYTALRVARNDGEGMRDLRNASSNYIWPGFPVLDTIFVINIASTSL